MPQLIEVPGMGQVEFPDGMTDDQIAGAIKRNGAMEKARKPIGQPEELTFGEKFAQRFLPDWLGDVGGAGGVRGSAVGRLAMGAADPGVAAFQLAANAVGAGDAVNKSIAETEAKYQAARKDAGSEGFDPLRMIGSTAITAPIGLAGKAATTLGGMAAKGAAQGALSGALNPVTEGEFWGAKGKQVGLGAAGGAVMAPAVGALARVISPRASLNADVAALREEGVRLTPGQALGGAMNTLEEKFAGTLPILGDAIKAARRRSVEDFNEAAINKALDAAGKGGAVTGAGFDSIAAAKRVLGSKYDEALSATKGVNFDTPQFNAEFGKLQGMAAELPEPLAKHFNKTVREVVLNQMSPNGSMLPETMQKVTSKLRELRKDWSRSGNMLDRDLGLAYGELLATVEREIGRQAPRFAQAKKAADAGYAALSGVKDAGLRATNTGGIFTPGQLNLALRGADDGAGKWATVESRFPIQKLAQSAQNVIGNTYPDSGSIGRALAAAGALGAGAINPAIPSALTAGSLAYVPQIQNALVAAIANRPDTAPAVANALRRYLAGPAAVMAGGYSGGGLSR